MSLYSSNLIILFPVGFSLYIAMRLADARADAQAGGAFRALIYTLVSLLISISLVGLLLRIGGILGLWLIAVPIVGLIILGKSTGLGRAAMLLSFTQLSSNGRTSQHLRMAGDFVRLNSGRVRKRAKKLQRLLATGSSLAPSLESSRIAKTDQEILCARSVDKYGPDSTNELPITLQPLRIQTEVERLMSRLTVVPWLMQGIPIVIFTAVQIIPTIDEMLVEFGMRFQGAALFLSVLDRWTDLPYNLLFLMLILLGFFLSTIVVLLVAVPQLIHVFPFRYFFNSYHRSVGLISLALAGKNEPNLRDACQVASQLVPSLHVSRRLELIAERISQGSSPQTALVELLFLTKREAAFVGNAITTRSLAWALQEIAVVHVERMLRRLSAFTQFAVIACVLSFAALYGAFAYFVLGVLSQMILHLS